MVWYLDRKLKHNSTYAQIELTQPTAELLLSSDDWLNNVPLFMACGNMARLECMYLMEKQFFIFFFLKFHLQSNSSKVAHNNQHKAS